MNEFVDRPAVAPGEAAPPGLPIVRSVAALREAVAHWRNAGRKVALVPTMGALHAGHLSLIAAARARVGAHGRIVASIFVNPKQFGAGEDLDRYPRDEAGDAALLSGAGCDLLFAPPAAEVYPPGFATIVRVPGLSDVLDGAARPGHFDGVATVVTKLLNMVRADFALFGEKDWQQLAIVRRLAADLDIDTAIIGCPIVRDPDGLALSSRNAYLRFEERARAVALPQALAKAAVAIRDGAPVAATLAAARATLAAAGFGPIDYVALCNSDLVEAATLGRPARLLGAAWLGKTRLIDNCAVDPQG